MKWGRSVLAIALLIMCTSVLSPLASGLAGEDYTLSENSWIRVFGGRRWDSAYCLQKTRDGGYIIAGYTSDNHGRYVYLIKTDGKGRKEWERKIGGRREEGKNEAINRYFYVEQTSDRGYIVTGSANPPEGYNDIWVIKTDGNGNVEWEKTFGTIYLDRGKFVHQINDGGYVVIGETDVETNHRLRRGVWIIKLDKSGNKEWDKVLVWENETNADIWIYCAQCTADGGYIVGGGLCHGSCCSRTSLLLMKLDENGNVTWCRTFGGGEQHNHCWASCVRQTSDGGYIVAGAWDSCKPWVIKTDANGNIEWEKKFLEIPSPYGVNESIGFLHSIRETADGGYIVVGDADAYYLWMGKLDRNGSLEWCREYPLFFFYTSGCDVVQAEDGGYVVLVFCEPKLPILLWLLDMLYPDLFPHLEENSNILLMKTDSEGMIDEGAFTIKNLVYFLWSRLVG